VADYKPSTYEYQFGGRCLAGAQTEDSVVEAVLNLIEGSRALYIPQGRLTIRFENRPEGGGSGAA
jgi:hypothetical protein